MIGPHALAYTLAMLALGAVMLLGAVMGTKRGSDGLVRKNTATGQAGLILGGAVFLLVGMMSAFFLIYAHFNP